MMTPGFNGKGSVFFDFIHITCGQVFKIIFHSFPGAPAEKLHPGAVKETGRKSCKRLFNNLFRRTAIGKRLPQRMNLLDTIFRFNHLFRGYTGHGLEKDTTGTDHLLDRKSVV